MMTTAQPTMTITEALTAYCKMLGANGFNRYGCGYELNRRYARVFRYDDALGTVNGSRSVVCFVEIATGDIYRRDSWKKVGRMTGANIYKLEGAVPQR